MQKGYTLPLKNYCARFLSAVAGKGKERLDNLLVRQGFASALSQARGLIMAGQVIVDDHMIDKPGTLVLRESAVRLKDTLSPYVSRGGEKLAKPLKAFNIPVRNKTVLDIGASTGGFTDCLLQNGAARIFAVDVGYGQLAWKLQQDPRVIRLDRTNITMVAPQDLHPSPDLIVIDASFTSLKRLLAHALNLLAPRGELLCLIKPQFEVSKEAVEKGGIVKDARLYKNVIQDVVHTALNLHLHISGIMESPVKGRKGNREFFMYAKKPSGKFFREGFRSTSAHVEVLIKEGGG